MTEFLDDHTVPAKAMNHVVLLGDSIFDNAAYVEKDVISRLRNRLPEGWKATLSAVDGSLLSDMADQVRDLPLDATHMIVSIGGNDALGHSDFLAQKARSISEALNRLSVIAEDFEREYDMMAGEVLGLGMPLALCTVYRPFFPDPDQNRAARTALAMFNDAIIRTAFRRQTFLLDLRLVCNEPSDFTRIIEPSETGGEKIARHLAGFIKEWGKRPGPAEFFR